MSTEERGAYAAQMAPVMEDLISKGVIIDSWGTNNDTSAYKADYDFFAVTSFPTQELLDQFLATIEATGWYNYFDQINMIGDNLGPQAVIGKMIEL